MFKSFNQPTTTGAFGTSGGFGSAPANANPFGQSTVFGKTTTTAGAFGGQPAFGQTPTAGTSTSSLFGQPMPSAVNNTSLFGQPAAAPAFGQTVQPSFGFGTTAQPTNIFGTQQTTGTGLFGATTTNTFGQTKPAFGSTFGGTGTGLFGAQQTQQTTTSLFGASTSTAGTGLFGQTGTTFGTSAGAQQMGTVIKFAPLAGTDTLQKGGQSQSINTRHYCITCMKEYEHKSLEELRYEDYIANRKGPQQQAGLFGSTGLQPFGQTSTQPATGLFGQPAVDPNKSLFGSSTTTGFGTGGAGVFGATQPATGAVPATNSLFGTKPTAFGAATTSAPTAFGGFGGATTSNTLFGAGAAPKPAFGAPTTSLFGQPAQTPAFGAGTGFGSGFGTSTNTQAGGLFGTQNKPAFGLGTSTAATTATTAFNFGQPTTSGGLFGAKPATAPAFGATTGAFGTTNTFGTNNTANSLFKPTTGTNTFGFGATSAPGLGGSTLGSTGTGLFGSTTQKPGGLFGTATTGGGLFGTGTATGFGTGTSTTFGSTGTGLGGSAFGSGTSTLFGTAPAVGPPASASITPAAHSAFMAMALFPFGDSPLYKNLLPAAGKTDALLKSTNNALTQKALQTTKDLKVNPTADTKLKVKPFMTSSQMQMRKAFFDDDSSNFNMPSSFSSPSTTTCGVRSLTIKPRISSDDWLNDIGSNKENLSSCETLSGSKKDSDGLPTEKSGRRVSFSIPLESPKTERKNDSSPGEPFYIRRNPLFKPPIHSTLVETHGLADSTNGLIESTTDEPSNSSNIINTLEIRKTTDDIVNESGDNTINQDSATSSCNNSLDETHGYLDQSSQIDLQWVPHKTGITLRRCDYYTIPSLDDLEGLVNDDGTCIVDNFCIGRHGYGNLFYDETMDVAGLDIDSIVHFRHKEVTVYPDDDVKPKVGEGLNRKCQVTLERVWPIDKTTREPITNPERLQIMFYEDKLRRSTGKMRAHFVEYRPHTGSWVFRVDHFSKYGITDSDNEEEEEKLPAGKPAPPGPKAASNFPLLVPKQCFPFSDSQLLPNARSSGSNLPNSSANFPLIDFHLSRDKAPLPVYDNHDLNLDMDMEDDDEEDEDEMAEKIVGLVPSDAPRVQLMKSSLFHSHHPEDELEELSRLHELENIAAASFTRNLQVPIARLSLEGSERNYQFEEVTETEIRPVLPPLVIRPRVTNLINKDYLISFDATTLGKIESKQLAECGLMMGRRFRPGWGPCSQFTCLTTRRSSDKKGTIILNNYSIVQKMTLFDNHAEAFRESIEKHLMIRLNHSLREEGEGRFPQYVPKPGVESLHEHCLHAIDLDIASYSEDPYLLNCRRVWELCAALWGNLPALSVEDEPASHRSQMMRKEALTEWLKKCAEPIVEKETKGQKDLRAIFSFLSARNVVRACEIAQKKGDHYLALLISSGPTGQLLLQQQLAEWTDVGADKYIQSERLKIYTLAAGLPTLQGTDQFINVCKGLDWRRVFALHYWYMNSPVSSIAEVLSNYEDAFSSDEAYTEKPHPIYWQNFCLSSDQVILDICFHILKLYSSKAHSLDQLLNPATHTADPLDCRLSWTLEQVLASLGYTHTSSLSSAILCTTFATQLEANGLWKWAVFVYLHLKDPYRRKQAVLDLLGRHVALLEEREYTEEELFVVDELGVNVEWVCRAKATRALTLGSYHDATFYLIHAAEFNQAHQIFIEHIAPDLFINEKYAYMREILECMAANATSISEWPNQGQLLLDYLDMVRQMQPILRDQDTNKLEAMLPNLASICVRVSKFPVHLSAKHRLCQAEIAKGTSHIYVNVKQLDRSEASLRDVKMIVSKLPLPQDYLSELMQLIAEAHRELLN